MLLTGTSVGLPLSIWDNLRYPQDKVWVYFLQKDMILGNGAKWNLRKDYEKSELLQLKFF